MKKRSFLFLLIIFILNIKVSALTLSINCSPKSVNVGDSISCAVNVSGEDDEIDFLVNVSASSNLELLSPSTITSNSATVTLKAKSSGTGTVTLSDGSSPVSDSITIEEVKPEPVALSLTSLSIDGNSISVSKDKTDYTYTTDKESVVINASGSDGANVTGIGEKNLNEGSNTFQIVVSKDGSDPKTYNVIVTRNKKSQNDEKKSDLPKLKSISLSSGRINFNPNTLEYNVSIDGNINSFSVNATPSEGASVKYSPSNTIDIKYGEKKTIQIIVLSPNGESTTYKINVTRIDLSNNDPSNNIAIGNVKLKSLTIDEIPFSFDPNTLEYNLNVENNIESITLNYEVSDPSLEAKLVGNTQLKEGKNKIKIVVSTQNGKSNTYVLNITRNKTRTVIENNEEAIIDKVNDESDTNDLYVTVDSNEEKIISSSILDALKNTKRALTYEVIKNSGIVYSVLIDGNKIKNTNDFNYQITFISEYEEEIYELINNSKYVPIKFKGEDGLPGSIHLNIYVGDKSIKDLKKVNLYKYSDNKLELVTKDIKIKDGYIDIDIDTSDQYVLGKKSDLKEISDNKSPIIVAIIIIAISFIISFILIKIRKKKAKDANTKK